MNAVVTPNPTTGGAPDGESLAMLACLREAVAEALERKRRLGQYWVHWTADGPRIDGPGSSTLRDQSTNAQR